MTANGSQRRGASRRPARSRYQVLTLAVVIAGATASGCTSEGAPTDSGKFQNVPADKIASDVFWSDKISLIGYARNKLAADCMAEQGYPQLNQAGVPRPPATFANADPNNDLGASSDVDTARRLGFGKDQPAQPAHVISFDRAFDTAMAKCQQDAAEKIGANAAKVEGQVFDLVNGATSDVDAGRNSGSGRDQLTAWTKIQLACLDAHGFHQQKQGARTLDTYGVGDQKGHLLGSDPIAPPETPGTVVVVPAAPARTYLPAPDEAALAVAYAQCTAQTGFNDKIVGQYLQLERASIGKHESEIDALGPTVDALAEQAAKLVGQ